MSQTIAERILSPFTRPRMASPRDTKATEWRICGKGEPRWQEELLRSRLPRPRCRAKLALRLEQGGFRLEEEGQMLLRAVLALILGLIATGALAQERAAERERMVETVVAIARWAGSGVGDAGLDGRVIEAMRKVPRHAFVPAEVSLLAYADRPLPIGRGQTISQPFIVALMTHLLQLKPGDRVLEIGTGSGYQAAVLSLIAREVCSVEIVPELGRSAAATLARLGHANVRTLIGDGYQGWPAHAPYDGIMVTAAPDHVPPALVAQLKPGGRLVIPVGGLTQELMLIEKAADGTTTTTRIIPVRFVPLTRGGKAD
jgi:protein-L-isoaspartate(D-aspartate) O-methyltransferase